jgi:glycosyltransferase involved in cell wall biosynthesis
MNNDETLVILTPGFPKDEADSTCLPMLQQFTRMLKELYPRLNIVVLSFQYPFFKKTYKLFDITVKSFAGRNKGGLFKLLLRKKIGAVLKDLHDTNKIKGILSFWLGECALMGKRFADKYGIKHYCWIQGQDAKEGNKYVNQIKPKADELIALSDFLQTEFENNYGITPKYVIPPGVDPKLFIAPTVERNIDLLAAGSLIPLKQYDIFIEIIAEIKKEFQNIKAMLIGAGPEKEKMEMIIEKTGLQSSVTLTGELSHTEVLQHMQRTKIFLHPSSYEGFGMVCLEALGAGAKVLSFVKPMSKEIKNWSIVQNKKEMKEKVLQILQHPDINQSPSMPFLMNNSVKAIAALFE